MRFYTSKHAIENEKHFTSANKTASKINASLVTMKHRFWTPNEQHILITLSGSNRSSEPFWSLVQPLRHHSKFYTGKLRRN